MFSFSFYFILRVRSRGGDVVEGRFGGNKTTKKQPNSAEMRLAVSDEFVGQLDAGGRAAGRRRRRRDVGVGGVQRRVVLAVAHVAQTEAQQRTAQHVCSFRERVKEGSQSCCMKAYLASGGGSRRCGSEPRPGPPATAPGRPSSAAHSRGPGR